MHRVLSALRSSRAALYEHLHGTAVAVAHFGLGRVKKDAKPATCSATWRHVAPPGPARVVCCRTAALAG